ncbi:hypothetical protein MBLNU459_g7268t2 [Dothideomycetes sp. NU459]
MPTRVRNLIAEETDKNCLHGTIPILAILLEKNSMINSAYLCHEAAKQVYKIRGEGDHFCGYRNIQMQLRSLAPASVKSDSNYPILEVQGLIEKAWDSGFNTVARVETGGILDTRKHIGTAEAQALLRSLDIPCSARAFPENARESKSPYAELLDFVQTYFETGTPTTASSDGKAKVHITTRSPIFFQRPRHSLTIVGLEKRKDGSRALIVFDPAYKPPKKLRQARGNGMIEVKSPISILKDYTRDEKYLKRFKAFELLYVDVPGR